MQLLTKHKKSMTYIDCFEFSNIVGICRTIDCITKVPIGHLRKKKDKSIVVTTEVDKTSSIGSNFVR